MSDDSLNARAVIADFGSAAKLQSPEETLRWRVGSTGYIAPEVFLGEPYSFSVDVWSLGCVMHKLLLSHCPF